MKGLCQTSLNPQGIFARCEFGIGCVGLGLSDDSIYIVIVTQEESTPRHTQLEVSLPSIPLTCLAIGLDTGLIQGQIVGSLRSFTQAVTVISVE